MADNWKNKLYFGDNLDIMRKYIADESVDLIYLDPPFNSKATYNVLFEEKNGGNPEDMGNRGSQIQIITLFIFILGRMRISGSRV